MDELHINNLIIMNSKIFRNSQVYLDKVLKQYELSSGSFRYLFVLEQSEGLSQNEISHKLGKDKAMSARIITKLIQSGYIERQHDAFDNRAYQLFLTEKAKKTIPKIRHEVTMLSELITENLNDKEKETLLDLLYKVFCNTQEFR